MRCTSFCVSHHNTRMASNILYLGPFGCSIGNIWATHRSLPVFDAVRS